MKRCLTNGGLGAVAIALLFRCGDGGGAAGFSYLAWVLSRHKVSVARSTMSQLIRFVLTFLSFVLLLLVAMAILTFNHLIDRVTVIIGGALFVAAVGATWFAIWLVNNQKRMRAFSAWVTRIGNAIVRFFTRGRKKDAVKAAVVLDFFDGLHKVCPLSAGLRDRAARQ